MLTNYIITITISPSDWGNIGMKLREKHVIKAESFTFPENLPF